jgi:predicted GNAT family N-acyltransferase
MAAYLAEALEDSRRARGDAIIGHRRLAKMMTQFYPNQRGRVVVDEEEEPQGRGRALIGRLMGRPLRPSQGGGHNADMFDVVTPFVSEWG